MSTAGTTRVRMSPQQRRDQLLEHGVRLLASRSLPDLTTELLADEAGISRGLLYHYFDSLQAFHRAVVHKAVEDLVAITAPGDGDDLLELLRGSLGAYVDYVVANLTGYRSLVRAASAGDPDLRALYEQARASLTDRMFDKAGTEGLTGLGYADTPAVRLMVRGWSALTEEVVLTWAQEQQDSGTSMSRDEVVDALAGSLFGALDAVRTHPAVGHRS